MDVERELTRVLRTVDVPPAADPVAGVRAGMRHRRQVRRVQMATAALAVVGLAVGASALLGDQSPRSRITPVPGASATDQASEAPTTEPTNAASPEATRSAPPPAYLGYVSADLTWVSVDDGFALVTEDCGDTTCSRLLRTTDGGRTWADVGAKGLPDACDTACPLRVRFADKEIGYAFGDGLVMTTDGGRTWARQPGPDTHGLEIAGGTAVRVVNHTPACPGCAFSVQRSDVGTSTWHTVYRSEELVSAVDLVRQGDDIAVDLRRNPAGGASDARSTLLVSVDGGTTWTRHDDPCGAGLTGESPDEVDTRQLTWSQDGQLVVLCQRRMYYSNGGNSTVVSSGDGGRSFGRETGYNELTDAWMLAAGRGVLLTERHQGIDGFVTLDRSTDGGQTWTEVDRAPLPQGAANGYLAFSTSQVVTWVPPGGDEVRRSTDAGQTWTTHSLR